MAESNLSDEAAAPARLRVDPSDVIVLLGVVLTVAGATALSPAAGIIVLGIALIIYGARGRT